MRTETARQAGATFLLGLLLAGVLISVGQAGFPSAMTPLAPAGPRDSDKVFHVPLDLADLFGGAAREETPAQRQVAEARDATGLGIPAIGSVPSQSRVESRRPAGPRISGSADEPAKAPARSRKPTGGDTSPRPGSDGSGRNPEPTQPRNPSDPVDPRPEKGRTGGGAIGNGAGNGNGGGKGVVEPTARDTSRPDHADGQPDRAVAHRDSKQVDGKRDAGPRAESPQRRATHGFAAASHSRGKSPKA